MRAFERKQRVSNPVPHLGPALFPTASRPAHRGLGKQAMQSLIWSRIDDKRVQRQSSSTDSSKAATSTIILSGDTTKVANPKNTLEKKQSDKTQAKSSGKVCLTFDDGPQNGTEDVLDVLGKNIKATFFLTGSNMSKGAKQEDAQEKLVRRMLADGHNIGNHTSMHEPKKTKDYKTTYGELKTKAQKDKFNKNFTDNRVHFEKLIGKDFPDFKLARLPGDGRLTSLYVNTVEAMGLKHVGWEYEFGTGKVPWLKVRNWHAIDGVAAPTTGLPSSGNVILFHDRHWAGANKAKFTKVIGELKGAGFGFGQLNKGGKCA
jgi:peptidoglycan/xylan/chitin deacetylase (PgdA/CDA1 family)